MADQKLKEHFEAADGLSTLHLLSHDPATDTVTYEERIGTPAAAHSTGIAMEPKTTTAQLWIGMTGGGSRVDIGNPLGSTPYPHFGSTS